jgi:hypothetical protein
MDRTTKLLLAAIALGLWANAVWSRAHAETTAETLLREIDSRLYSIDDRLHSPQYGDSQCRNTKICD